MSESDFNPFAAKVNTEGTTKESAHDGGGGQIEVAGFYHLVCQSAEYKGYDAENSKLPHVEMKLEVLAGENESEVGKKLYHTIWLATWEDKKTRSTPALMEDKHATGVLILLHAFGVVGDEVFDNPEVILDPEWFDRLENTTAIGKVVIEPAKPYKRDGVEHPGKERATVQWNNDFYHVKHEAVAEVPKDAAVMQYAAAEGDEDMDDL